MVTFSRAFAVLGSLVTAAARSKQEIAENARWLLHETSWGYLTSSSNKVPFTDTFSFSDGAAENSTGRIFFYVMGGFSDAFPEGMPAALTVSEAEIDSSRCNRKSPSLDPEDPRCAKLTLSGNLTKSSGADIAIGKAVLFARHPQMQHWPSSHHFEVHELILRDIWLIDFFGGGELIAVADFLAAAPKHTTPYADGATAVEGAIAMKPPPYFKVAERARWLMYHSSWCVLGTNSVRLMAPWGNVRSLADGLGKNSTGLPMLYLPTPDPSSVDVHADSRVALGLSEAGLPGSCSETEDPVCARLTLQGRLRPLTSSELPEAKRRFAARHPLAKWLAEGGAHTGGTYYTIDLQEITFLDYYGGPANLTVAEYLAASPHVSTTVYA